jgi:hypothetical protein
MRKKATEQGWIAVGIQCSQLWTRTVWYLRRTWRMQTRSLRSPTFVRKRIRSLRSPTFARNRIRSLRSPIFSRNRIRSLRSYIRTEPNPFATLSYIRTEADPFATLSYILAEAGPFPTLSYILAEADPFATLSYIRTEAGPFATLSYISTETDPFATTSCILCKYESPCFSTRLLGWTGGENWKWMQLYCERAVHVGLDTGPCLIHTHLKILISEGQCVLGWTQGPVITHTHLTILISRYSIIFHCTLNWDRPGMRTRTTLGLRTGSCGCYMNLIWSAWPTACVRHCRDWWKEQYVTCSEKQTLHENTLAIVLAWNCLPSSTGQFHRSQSHFALLRATGHRQVRPNSTRTLRNVE